MVQQRVKQDMAKEGIDIWQRFLHLIPRIDVVKLVPHSMAQTLKPDGNGAKFDHMLNTSGAPSHPAWGLMYLPLLCTRAIASVVY